MRDSPALTDAAPPRTLDEVGPVTRAIEIASIVGAAGLVVANVVRLAASPGVVRWHTPVVLFAAWVLADMASGFVHWAADTWGSEAMPVLGPRFLRPFRVHHANPDDFLRRNFADTNGDVALLSLPVLGATLLVPLGAEGGRVATVLVVAFATFALPTNQVHQWAHSSRPPTPVRWLQRSGVLLSREQHTLHHAAPFATHYCITNGWCNRVLAALDLFARLERAIAFVTGAVPRADEDTTAARGTDSARVSGARAS